MSKRRKPAVHLARSKALLVSQGWTVAETVERINRIQKPGGALMVWREDLAGFADVEAWAAGMGNLMVQVCALSAIAAHKAKIVAEPRALEWLRATRHNAILLHAWDQPRGPKTRWLCREVAISQADFVAAAARTRSADRKPRSRAARPADLI